MRRAVASRPARPARRGVSGCDIVTADSERRARPRSAEVLISVAVGAVEISNVNGRIDVQPSTGNTVEIIALKSARAGTSEAAKEALDRIEILDTSSGELVKIETRLPRGGQFLRMGNTEVRYTVKVPAAADVDFSTVNGGIEVSGLTGRIKAETTNGGIVGRSIGGPIEASTTNGGVEVEVTRIAARRQLGAPTGDHAPAPSGAEPRSRRASPTAASCRGLNLDKSESSRRRLEARMNGGGPPCAWKVPNGGINIDGRCPARAKRSAPSASLLPFPCLTRGLPSAPSPLLPFRFSRSRAATLSRDRRPRARSASSTARESSRALRDCHLPASIHPDTSRALPGGYRTSGRPPWCSPDASPPARLPQRCSASLRRPR